MEAVERLERTMIVDALEKNGWIKARAARTLGITERMISYKMENLGIRKD
ncbi:MAG TPA: helix-turn-helix domain-containing protein [Planctomycetota bacterium]|nr:helix-turn-helix domain-containing protein [Planctomycetota bacterium]